MYPSTISSWALMVAKTIDSAGCDSKMVFKEVGLEPEKLSDPNARYSALVMSKLWKRALELTNNPGIGITAANYWHPTTMHALGFSWMASGTLKEAVNRLIRYSRVMNDAIKLSLTEATTSYWLKIEHPKPRMDVATEAIDAALAVVIKMCRSSVGEDFQPKSVSMRRSMPEYVQQYETYFKSPIMFGADSDAIEFSKSQLNAALPTGNAEIARANDKVINEYLLYMDRNDIVTQVKIKLIDLLPSGQYSEEQIAHAIHLSQRSLQRRLKGEKTTYKEILADTRRELALQFIADSRYSISEMAYMLGFSEPANFSRAFKRWTGQSPSESRVARLQ